MTPRPSLVTSSDHAVFTARVLEDTPRPVLLVSVDGEVDRTNEETLRDLVARAGDVSSLGRRYAPPTAPDCAAVVDLRLAWFVSSSVYGCLLDEGARLGQRIRLVVPAQGVARRTLRFLGLTADFDVHTDLSAATTGAAAPGPHA